MSNHLALHQHGKSRVRVGRVWREGLIHHFVEWNVSTMLESDMAHAFLTPSNQGMTATDTQKNAVYFIAKQMSRRCSPEEYALALARHFVKTYPLVSKAKITVEQAPWKRLDTPTGPHNHGYIGGGTEIRTCYVEVDKSGIESITSGVKELKVLKTTQSGYSGFLHDEFTTLPDVTDRMVATIVTATWKYSTPPRDYCAAFSRAKAALLEAFYGPSKEGVFSPSVQYTLFQMAKAVMNKVPEIESVFLNMPNLHFLPCNPVTSTFDNDVYIATSEPHGNIEATVTRTVATPPHCKL